MKASAVRVLPRLMPAAIVGRSKRRSNAETTGKSKRVRRGWDVSTAVRYATILWIAELIAVKNHVILKMTQQHYHTVLEPWMWLLIAPVARLLWTNSASSLEKLVPIRYPVARKNVDDCYHAGTIAPRSATWASASHAPSQPLSHADVVAIPLLSSVFKRREILLSVHVFARPH